MSSQSSVYYWMETHIMTGSIEAVEQHLSKTLHVGFFIVHLYLIFLRMIQFKTFLMLPSKVRVTHVSVLRGQFGFGSRRRLWCNRRDFFMEDASFYQVSLKSVRSFSVFLLPDKQQ